MHCRTTYVTNVHRTSSMLAASKLSSVSYAILLMLLIYLAKQNLRYINVT